MFTLGYSPHVVRILKRQVHDNANISAGITALGRAGQSGSLMHGGKLAFDLSRPTVDLCVNYWP